MLKSFFLPLSQAHQWPESEIGSLGYHLGKLEASQVKVAPGFLVPRETFLKIAQDNQLDHQLLQFFHQHDTKSGNLNGLKQLFDHLKISPEIKQSYLETFYRTIGDKKTSVVASWRATKHGHLAAQSQPIAGDANVWQAILETWALSVELTIDPNTTTVNVESLVPASLLVQSHLQPTIGGQLLTQTPHKAVYDLVVTIPPKLATTTQPAHILIDIRSWQVVSSQLPSGVSLKQLEKILPVNQMLEIAQIAYRVKLHDLHQLQISWEVSDKEIYVSNVERLPQLAERASTVQRHETGILLVGTPVVHGIATGPVRIVTQELAEKHTFDHEIVVTKNIDHLSLHNLAGLRGMICEEVPSWQVQQLLNQYHIPCLARTLNATTKLSDGQEVTLDATLGKVLPAQPSVQPQPSLFATKHPLHLAAMTHQAWDQPEYPTLSSQSIVFQPEAYWLGMGVHPLHVLKSHQGHQLKKEIIRALTSYRSLQQPLVYRPATLRSDQLLKLEHGHRYETVEGNPALGYTGAVRLLHQPEALKFELEIIKEAQRSLSEPLTILLPPARTPQELEQLLVAFSPLKVKFWAEIAYPASIFELQRLSLDQVEYVVLKTQTLLALAQGIDPYYPDLVALYTDSSSLLTAIVEQVLTHVSAKQVILEIKRVSQTTIHLAVDKKIGGLMSPLSDLQTTYHLVTTAAQHTFRPEKLG